MAFNTLLANRIENLLSRTEQAFEAKKMMGGICFMVNGKMCIGVHEDRIMARVGPDQYEEALQQAGSMEMNFTGKSMRGYVFVDGKVVDTEPQLEYWVDKCLLFNPMAKSSKRK
ncbi:TfoX/Sxy family protein [Echinicola soli]|uniref:TfoX/Sxy family protein n=1 Tax=Echinicola soli TaxID=2591634 RepID=A0A514CES3_9BACT|nr:TfoX/Sxy family protein [Echinicola soli]QDH78286.1 TfoX/Sxy family protein [Echinicola soli]